MKRLRLRYFGIIEFTTKMRAAMQRPNLHHQHYTVSMMRAMAFMFHVSVVNQPIICSYGSEESTTITTSEGHRTILTKIRAALRAAHKVTTRESCPVGSVESEGYQATYVPDKWLTLGSELLIFYNSLTSSSKDIGQDGARGTPYNAKVVGRWPRIASESILDLPFGAYIKHRSTHFYKLSIKMSS